MKMIDKIEKLLSKIKIQSLTKKEANLVWTKINKNIINKEKNMSLSFNYKLMTRAIATALIVLVVSVPSARAANNAKPGDFLFPVDRALEELQILLAREDKADELKLKFAQERVEEVRIILAGLNNENNNDQDESPSENGADQNQGKEHAKGALETALSFVFKVREDLEAKGNTHALETLSDVIDRLTDNVSEDTEFEVKIKNKKQKVFVEIKSDKGGKKVSIQVNGDGEFIEVGKGKGNDKSQANNKNKNVLHVSSLTDDHDDDDKNEGDENQESGNNTLVCHIPPGNKDNAKTISVSHNALPAHLRHGDHEGRCEGESEDDDNNENTAPVITLLGDNPLELLVGDTYIDPGAAATDAEDGDITTDIVVGGDMVDTNTVGSYIVTYDVMDSESLSAIQVTRTVNVSEVSNTAPIITLLGDNPLELLVADAFVDPGATANDIEDGDITVDIIVAGDTVDTSTAGSYVITYNVMDSESLSATQVTRTVNVSEVPKQCADGSDNDTDGLIDVDDPGCHTDNDASNAGSYDAEDDDETDSVANAHNVESQPTTTGIQIAAAKSEGKGNSDKEPKSNNGKNNR